MNDVNRTLIVIAIELAVIAVSAVVIAVLAARGRNPRS